MCSAEWAYRIAQSVGAAERLAQPFGEFAPRSIPTQLSLRLRWDAGDAVVLRTLRTHRFAPPAGAKSARGNPRPERSNRSINIESSGHWASFDFVNLDVEWADSQERVTLDLKSRSASITVADLEPGEIKINARGTVAGIGKEVTLPSRWRGRERIEIELPAVNQAAFLLKAERSWLREVGTLKVQVGHSRLARLLLPEDGIATLDPNAGDLSKSSAVIRALLWGEAMVEPFRFRIDLGAGLEIVWEDTPDNGDVLVTDRQIGMLRLWCSGEGCRPAAVEAGIPGPATGENTGTVRSLGEKPLTPGLTGLSWIVPPRQQSFAIRSRFEHEGQSLRTPWNVVHPSDGPLMVPGARLVSIVIFASESDLEVEVAPADGELDQPCRKIARKGTPAKLEVLSPLPSSQVRYRARPWPAGDWSAWEGIEHNLIRTAH